MKCSTKSIYRIEIGCAFFVTFFAQPKKVNQMLRSRVSSNLPFKISYLRKNCLMNKRTFLKLSSALMAAPLLPPFIRNVPDQQPITNWAGNLTYGTTNIEYPTSVDAMQQLVKKYNKFKVLGTRHCFNTI